MSCLPNKQSLVQEAPLQKALVVWDIDNQMFQNKDDQMLVIQNLPSFRLKDLPLQMLKLVKLLKILSLPPSRTEKELQLIIKDLPLLEINKTMEELLILRKESPQIEHMQD